MSNTGLVRLEEVLKDPVLTDLVEAGNRLKDLAGKWSHGGRWVLVVAKEEAKDLAEGCLAVGPVRGFQAVVLG